MWILQDKNICSNFWKKLKRDQGLFSPTGSLMGGAMLSGWSCKK
jgi:hypothetical protein